jgi:hypothetical protein
LHQLIVYLVQEQSLQATADQPREAPDEVTKVSLKQSECEAARSAYYLDGFNVDSEGTDETICPEVSSDRRWFVRSGSGSRCRASGIGGSAAHQRHNLVNVLEPEPIQPINIIDDGSLETRQTFRVLPKHILVP